MSSHSKLPLPSHNWSDQRMEIIIGTLLRTGVLLAGAVVLAGAVLYLVRHGHEVPRYTQFQGEPDRLKTVPDIVHGAVALSAPAIIQLGMLLLIATPIARVLFSAIGFALEHDYMYVFITLIVLGILLYSLLGSS